MSYYLYILKGRTGYLYTGITGHLEKRLREHNSGLSKVTKNKGPFTVIYFEEFKDKFSAAKREKEIKGWSREKKLRLALRNGVTNGGL